MRKSILIFLAVACAALSGQANAVEDNNAIDWDASPVAFITSLYWGVLGRAPDPGGLTSWTSAWTAKISANPTARLKVFEGFVASAEHRSLASSRDPRTYAVFYRTNGNRIQYTVAKRPNGWHTQTGYMSYREAAARRDYYNMFHYFSKDNPRPRQGGASSRSGPACRPNQCLSNAGGGIFGLGGSCVSRQGARGGVCGTSGN